MPAYRAYTAARLLADLPGPPPRRQFMGREVMAQLLAGAEARLPVLDAPELPWAQAERVHDPEYLRRWRVGEVTHAEENRLGFRWDPAIVRRSRLSSGGTLAATRDALKLGWGLNLGGGTHHAYRDRAEGFSFLNDVVIATRWALDEGGVGRVLILDLDVHQGNGTARMLAEEPRALTLSLHADRNYPFQKEQSDLDLGLPDGTGDAAYLAALDELALPAVEASKPDLIFFLAGADVLAGDQLGRLALSLDGLRARDERVFAVAARAGIPLVTVLAGGYNRDPQLTVRARLGTIDAGLAAFGAGGGA